MRYEYNEITSIIFITLFKDIITGLHPSCPGAPYAADTITSTLRVYLAPSWRVVTNGALFFFNQWFMLPGHYYLH